MSGSCRPLRRQGDGSPIRDDASDSHPLLRKLECLYRISEVVEERADSLPNILRGIAEILPRAWQSADPCRARIILRDERYETEGFRESAWRQAAPIRVRGKSVGQVEVFFQEAPAECGDGPFLREERELIDTVAARIGRIAERYLLEEELSATREALHEAKAALRGIFSQINEERAEIGRSINANVEKVLLPQIRALANQVSSHQMECLTLLEKGMTELTSPFTHRLSRVCQNLTPTEIEICGMIRSGMSTKEVARLRHVAPATVFKQRESIRRKLSIVGNGVNLTAHLLAVTAEIP